MSQKLSRTINLPRPPASFDPEVRRFFDDYSRSITQQFQDAFDLFGEGDASLEVHVGNTGLVDGQDPPHGATDTPKNGTIVKRTDEGKIRFTGADGTEGSEDYGVTYGQIAQMNQHITQTESVHGCTTVPIAGHIAAFGAGGVLKGGTPSAENDLVPKSYVAFSVQPDAGKFVKFGSGGRLHTSYPESGNDVASYEFVVNAINNSLSRLVVRTRIYDAVTAGDPITLHELEDDGEHVSASTITIPPGLYFIAIRLPAIQSGHVVVMENADNGTDIFLGYGCSTSGVFRLASQTAMILKSTASLPATYQFSDAGYGLEIISL